MFYFYQRMPVLLRVYGLANDDVIFIPRRNRMTLRHGLVLYHFRAKLAC